jgi:hypothetical protein
MLQFVGLVLFTLIVGYISVRYAQIEGFADPVCPDKATRDSDGTIRAGGKAFKNLEEYTSYMRDLYAQGAQCIPPRVELSAAATRPTLPLGALPGGFGNNNESPEASQQQGATREVLNQSADEFGSTSAKTPIKKLDDYEYTRVFKTESQLRNGLSPETKSDLLNKYVLDWSKLPFNSQIRADKEDEFVSGRMETGFTDPASGVFFKNIENPQIVSPAEEAAKMRERALLAHYQPTDVSTHVIDSDTAAVAKLVHDEYATDPNWEPVVVRTDENKWEVKELRPKSRKEKWEDAQTIGLAAAESSQQVLAAPSISIRDRLQEDPYFDKAGVTDKDNDRVWKYSDFNKFTPGLERMFAPTFSQEQWN